MTRIRYKNLASGLHGRAERCGRRTTIFLVPGLTGAQRKAALRRLRQEARRGCGPRLPVPQLAVALVADRVRVAFRYTGAVIRLHPAGSILPTAAIGCLMVLFVLASVSVRIIPQPGAAGSGGVPVNNGPGAGGSGPGAVPRVTGPDRAGRAGPGASSMLSRILVAWSPGSGAGGTGSESGASGPGSGTPPGSGSGLGSDPASPGMSVRVGASVGSAVSAGTSASAGAGGVSAGVAAGVGGMSVPVSASVGPSPSQSPSRGASSHGDVSVCVNIGPFGGCVGL